MLDLVVKAAEHEGNKPAAADISGGDHLAAGETGRGCGFDDRHPLVVRRETDAQVQREDRVLYGHEGECLERGEHPQHRRQVQRGVQHDERPGAYARLARGPHEPH